MKVSHVFLPALFAPLIAYGTGCENYPYADGLNIEDVTGGTKILATATATVTFDDADSVRDAKDEAILLAKADISKFLTETMSSDEGIEKAVNETKSMSGSGKAAERKEVVNRVKTLRNSSRALLRGVVLLGDCYTKGVEVRVSVGIKPETINSAANLAGGITNSTADQSSPAPGMSPPGAVRAPGQGVDGYSNTDRLNKF